MIKLTLNLHKYIIIVECKTKTFILSQVRMEKGKTTASYTILPEIIKCKEFINADKVVSHFVCIAKLS